MGEMSNGIAEKENWADEFHGCNTFDKWNCWFEEVVDFRADVFWDACSILLLPARLRRRDLAREAPTLI